MKLRGGHPLSEADSEIQSSGNYRPLVSVWPICLSIKQEFISRVLGTGGVPGTHVNDVHGLVGDTLTVTPSEMSLLGRPWAEGCGGGTAALLSRAQGGPQGDGLREHRR